MVAGRVGRVGPGGAETGRVGRLVGCYEPCRERLYSQKGCIMNALR